MLAIKKNILFFFLFLVPAGVVCAQSSSQATMQVSANVIYAGSVAVDSVQSTHVASLKYYNIGSLRLKGEASQHKMVNTSREITLIGPSGEVTNLNVVREEEGFSQSGSSKLQLQRTSDQNLAAGVYAGEFSTTVEYF